MAVVPQTVLGPQRLAEINQALQSLDNAAQQVELAKRAGIDVKDSEAQIETSRSKLMQIKQVYFPGQ